MSDTETTERPRATPKGYPVIGTLGGRLQWARSERGWDIQTAVEKLNQNPPTGKSVHWLLVKQLESTPGGQPTTDEQRALVEGLAKQYRVDSHWLANGPTEREPAPVKETPPMNPDHPPRILAATPAFPDPIPPAPISPEITHKNITRAGVARLSEVMEGTFGAKLRARRIELNQSQADIAKALGTTGWTISALETNKPNAVSDTMKARVARYLGLDDEANALEATISEPSERRPRDNRFMWKGGAGVKASTTGDPTMERLGLVPGAPVRVKKQRQVLGLTQHDLSHAAGIQPYELSNIEAGKSTKPIDVHKIAGALDVTPEYLLHGSGGPSVPMGQPDIQSKERGREPPKTAIKAEAETAGPVIRPMSLTNVEIEADNDAFYLFCSRRVYRTTGDGGVTGINQIGATLALSPRLAKGLLMELQRTIAEYEKELGKIT